MAFKIIKRIFVFTTKSIISQHCSYCYKKVVPGEDLLASDIKEVQHLHATGRRARLISLSCRVPALLLPPFKPHQIRFNLLQKATASRQSASRPGLLLLGELYSSERHATLLTLHKRKWQPCYTTDPTQQSKAQIMYRGVKKFRPTDSAWELALWVHYEPGSLQCKVPGCLQ